MPTHLNETINRCQKAGYHCLISNKDITNIITQHAHKKSPPKIKPLSTNNIIKIDNDTHINDAIINGTTIVINKSSINGSTSIIIGSTNNMNTSIINANTNNINSPINGNNNNTTKHNEISNISTSGIITNNNTNDINNATKYNNQYLIYQKNKTMA